MVDAEIPEPPICGSFVPVGTPSPDGPLMIALVCTKMQNHEGVHEDGSQPEKTWCDEHGH